MIFADFKRNYLTRGDAAAFLVTAGDRAVPITWRQFGRDIACAAWLAQRHAAQAPVALLGENSYEWMVAHVACVFSGVVVVPLEPTLSPAEIAQRLAFTGVKILLHSARCADRAQGAAKLLSGLRVAAFGSRSAERFMARAAEALDAGARDVFSSPRCETDETAMIVFTSGTTSKPRGAELTFKGLETFSAYWRKTLRMEAGQHSLMLLPLHHIFGICVGYMMLAHGITLGICPDFRSMYDAVIRFRADFLFLVPALADVLAAKIEQHGQTAEAALGAPLPWVVVGGAPLSGRTYARLMALGIQPLGGYGLTETTALYAVAPFGNPMPGSAGKSCDGFAGMETKVSADGELLVKGPAVMKGYYKESAHTAEVLKDGWLHTGDMGRIDADGFVWITGRNSRTIVFSSGKKVAPEELEEKLLSLPGVQDVVVSGDYATRVLRAEIYTTLSRETIVRQVDSLNRQLPIHKRIRDIVMREEPFPRTASGKICVAGQAARAVETVAVPSRTAERARVRRRTRISFSVALVAASILCANLFPLVFESVAFPLPKGLETVLDLLEECGEIVLAIWAIFAYALSRYLFPDGEAEKEAYA